MPRHQTDCRYFANGICSKGNACSFVHDVATRNENICQFNLIGKCSYGQACRFKHTRPRNDERPTTSRLQTTQHASRNSPSQQQATLTQARVRPVKLAQPGLNVKAAEFVPSWKMAQKTPNTSYASAAASSSYHNGECSSSSTTPATNAAELAKLVLCPYHQKSGDCNRRNGGGCPFAHGDHCDMCNQWSLHPFNQEQRRQHRNECLASHSQEMERAFLLQKTETKTCGICMELIFEKNLRFGILNGCQHCFCLDCIRQWRSRDQESAELTTKTVRSCPECRQHSDYVIPSLFWVEKGEEKDLLIAMYKENMKSKVCKYYSDTRHKGSCPFGNKCFYKHQLPDGSIDPGESPTSRRRPRLADYLFDDSDSDDETLQQRLQQENGQVAFHELMDNLVLGNGAPRLLSMYSTSFDPEKLVAECVDTIRAVTDAPLANCDIALQSVIQILEPHLGEFEKFLALKKCAEKYEINVDTCHDRVVLDEAARALFGIFLEKQELSYSADQDDETICTGLVAFCDIVKKTDSRIPLAVISANNWEWISQLLIVLQTDQNDRVREHLLNTLQVLMEQCGDPVKRMLLDSQLAISLVPLTQKSNGIQIPSLKLLAAIYSTQDVAIPLEHTDYLNTEYFRRVNYHFNEYHKTDVFELYTNFSYLIEQQQQDSGAPLAVFESIRDDPYSYSEFGIIMIQELNRRCTVRRLKFLSHVIELGESILDKMFYENDLKVLAHVLARESINHDEQEVRRLCLTSLHLLLETNTVRPDEDIQYALSNFDEH